MTQSPENFTISDDYIFEMRSWGNFFYKKYDQNMNFTDAVAQCESDGAYLAFPRSSAENDFINDFLHDGSQSDKIDSNSTQSQAIKVISEYAPMWIGIHDNGTANDGVFVSVDDADLSFRNWHINEPRSWSAVIKTGTGVVIAYKKWFTRHTDQNYQFGCFKKITCKFYV